jgi:hypothetical protein
VRRNRAKLLAADGKTLAPLRASPLDDETAILRAHADQEAVRPAPAAAVGLERSLAFHVISTESGTNFQWYPTGFGGVNHPLTVLQSASFPWFDGGLESPIKSHARLVYTQSFPHLWKKLWKIERNRPRQAVYAMVTGVLH